MKKILSLVLVLMMMVAVSAYAVPSSQLVGEPDILKRNFGANLTELPVTTDDVTLNVWRGLNSTIMTDWSQNIMFTELENRTGVHVDWLIPPVGSEADNFNLRIATNDLPHMFWQTRDYWGSKSIDEAIEDEIFLDITPYYEAGMTPNYKYLRDTYEDIAFDTILDSGRLGVFWQMDYVGTSPWSGFWVRQDLLDAHGLELPVTVADWENVLGTLYENGGYQLLFQAGANGGGGGDLDTHFGIFSAFDVGYRYYQVDGVIKYGPMEDGFKQALELLAKWYANGWIDPDWATYDWNGHCAAVADPSKYSIFGLNYGEIAQASVTARLTVPEFKMTPINGPVLEEGQELNLRQYDFLIRSQYDALTYACLEDGVDEVAMKWHDYFYSQDGGDLHSYGVEGITYQWNEDGVLEWLYQSPESVEYFPTVDVTDPTYDFWTLWPLFKSHNGAYLRDSGAQPMAPEVWECIAEWAKVTPSYGIPMTSFTAEESADYANANTQCQDLVDEYVGKIINGQEPVDAWDNVQQQLLSMGIEDCIEIQQTAYDRYMARGN
ncbi:MAG: hypothetical protein Q4A66_06625 [Eubacteriales bacterium]|nr:hypothetical protein [Eubacteriales bacterium]